MKVRVPADVDMADRVLANLTARQLAILGAHALVLWGLWAAVGRFVPPFAFGALAVPLATLGFVWATVKIEGTTLEQLAASALRHVRTPQRRVTAPEGIPTTPEWAPAHVPLAPMDLPYDTPRAEGIVSLGGAGHALICRASSINFGLRSETEQGALVDAFGRLLNGIDAPMQILIRSDRADLGSIVTVLGTQARDLPHPALEASAREHAAFLQSLASRRDVLARQVLVCFRDPSAGDAETAAARLSHRIEEAESLLRGLGIRLRRLDEAEAARLLRRASDPEAPMANVPEDLDVVIEGAR